MNIGLITSILESIMRSLPPDGVKSALDNMLDHLEDWVAKSPNKVDDALVLPFMNGLRAQLGISETPGSVYEDKPKASIDVNVTVKDETK